MKRVWSRSARPPACLLALTALALACVAPGAASAKSHPPHGKGKRPHVLYVAPSGADTNACTSAAPCKTIGHAVARASKRGTVIVEAGTYPESVTLTRGLRLVGTGSPVIDATGLQNGIVVSGPGAARSVVSGFVVSNADQEGILATHTHHVTIRHNTVQHNDLGAAAPTPTGECAPQGEIPGDCGEGIHLMSVTHSKVLSNSVTQNVGGILITDELGPSSHNLISRNHVFGNAFDCGITIAGHNDQAFKNGRKQPTVGGIYHNRIMHNVSDQNGQSGEGAGILLAGAGPGTAVYSNLVKGNETSGNELSGITLHSHAPGDDLNGNRIINNRVGTNNTGGDPDAGVTDTTGILIFSAVTPLKNTVVRGNRIHDVHFGIWTKNAPTIPAGANQFTNVAVPLSQN